MTDELRESIERDYVIERSGWAPERVARVTERLQRDVPADQRFESLVVWWAEHSAFTVFGRTIYLSRRLLERLADDDAVAFVVAHELAHHRLGHIPAGVTARLLPARLVLALLGTWLCSSAHEADADRLAIELCMTAGYDPERCLAALEILTLVSLDYGDVDGVLGGTGRRSHPALSDRIAEVRAHAAGVQSGARLDVQRTLARDRQQRKHRILTGLAGTAAAALVVLRRLPGR